MTNVSFQSMLAFVIIMNIIGFLSIRADKIRLKNKEPRIKELFLFSVAGFFGGVGVLISMLVFKHKTYKWYFKVFIPVLAIFNIILASLILYLMYEAGIPAEPIV